LNSLFQVALHLTPRRFNEHFVTTDVAEPDDLETFLEVGSWYASQSVCSGSEAGSYLRLIDFV